MRRIALPWIAVAVVLPAVGWPLLAQPQPPGPTILDTLRADYLEDEQTGRRLADLRADLQAVGDTVRLRLRIAAIGEHVDPAPGYRGIAGANHVTALDLTDHFERGLLKVVVMPRHGTEKRFGTIRPGARASIPERRLLPNGVLDLDATTAETYLVDIECLTPPLTEGEHEVYLEAKGLPRLRADLSVRRTGTGPRGRIHRLVSIGSHEVRRR